VFAGHAAIATFVKGKRPSLPLALLVPVAFGPDWIDLLSHLFHHPSAEVSHSLVSVGIVSLVIVVSTIPFFGAVDAAVLGATYVSHWLADCVTGLKPTWPGGPSVGLHLYTHSYRDVVLESVVVVACWLVYRSSLRVEVRNSIAAYAMPLGLIAMQVVFAFLQAPTLF
jgi:hypothetical protein